VNSASKIDLNGVQDALTSLPGLQVSLVRKRRRDIPFLYLHVSGKSCLSPDDPRASYFLLWNSQDKHYLWFENGVVVGWGMSESDYKSLDRFTSAYSADMLSQPITEQMKYTFGEKAMVDTELDQLVVSEGHSFDEIVLYSIALSRSVKLEEIEGEVERVVSNVQQTNFKHLSIGHKKGAVQCRDNLATVYQLEYTTTDRSLIDKPGFLWDRPQSQSHLYNSLSAFLELDSRVKIANSRLELPRSYWELENTHFHHKNGWRLEQIIIVGIFLEIVLHMLGKSEQWEDSQTDFLHSMKEWFFYTLGVRGLLTGETLVEETTVEYIPLHRGKE